MNSAVVSENAKTSNCCGDGAEHWYVEGLFLV